MKKTLYSKFDKKLISALPSVTFQGRIITILTATDADKAVAYLLSQTILGIDTETRPAFRKGVHHNVALLQVSTKDTCFLFRLNRTGVTASIKKLLEDTVIPKIGLSLHDDMLMLHRVAQFKPGYFIDLQNSVKGLGIEDMSLQKLYANFFGQRISKTQRLTNWEAKILTDRQKAYAATDAWSCIMLYEELKRLEETNDYELIKVEVENDEESISEER